MYDVYQYHTRLISLATEGLKKKDIQTCYLKSQLIAQTAASDAPCYSSTGKCYTFSMNSRFQNVFNL